MGKLSIAINPLTLFDKQRKVICIYTIVVLRIKFAKEQSVTLVSYS